MRRRKMLGALGAAPALLLSSPPCPAQAEALATVNARNQGIATAVAGLIRIGHDRVFLRTRGLLVCSCERALLLMQTLNVSLADLETSGANPNDLELIRIALAYLDEWYRTRKSENRPFAAKDIKRLFPNEYRGA